MVLLTTPSILFIRRRLPVAVMAGSVLSSSEITLEVTWDPGNGHPRSMLADAQIDGLDYARAQQRSALSFPLAVRPTVSALPGS